MRSHFRPTFLPLFIVLLLFEFVKKIHGCEIQDISTSISITVKFEEMTDDDEDDDNESDKHLEARDRRYSCLKLIMHVCNK